VRPGHKIKKWDELRFLEMNRIADPDRCLRRLQSDHMRDTVSFLLCRFDSLDDSLEINFLAIV
jgi:hypothetical protein